MQGDSSDPGIVLQTLQDIFSAIKRSQGRDFLLGLSMLEIYNEVRPARLTPALPSCRITSLCHCMCSDCK